MNKIAGLLLVVFLGLLNGCALPTTADVMENKSPLGQGATWALLPIVNHTAEPQAGLRAEAITENLLRMRGIFDLQRYPAKLGNDSVFAPADRNLVSEAQAWARKERIRYAVTGAVDEWRYKAGVDGEPVVGITLQVIDLQSNQVVWSAVGAKSGGSRQAVSAVAQDLLRDLLGEMHLKQGV